MTLQACGAIHLGSFLKAILFYTSMVATVIKEINVYGSVICGELCDAKSHHFIWFQKWLVSALSCINFLSPHI